MDNKFIVVSGGTKGIGKAIIERFSANGFNIITCSRNLSDLEALKADIENKYNNSVHIVKADLSRQEEVKNFVQSILNITDHVDVLVNNSGVFIPGQIHTEEEGTLEKMIDTNLYSAYHLSRGLIPSMKKQGAGHIFNMCSIASITAYASGGSYSISKFAMYGMSKSLREELKEFNIRVTAVLPGATYTASWEGVDIPEERFMKSEDVAEAVYAAHQMSPSSVMEEVVIRPQLGDL